MKLIFWQNIPSIHQSALINALAANNDISVTLVCQENIPSWRQASGWSIPDFGDAQVIITPSDEVMYDLINQSREEIVHIFSGLSAYPLVWQAYRQCILTKAQIGLYSETADWTGLKGFLRLLRGRYVALRYKKRIDFILAIGNQGQIWFERSGFPKEKIFPFAYFVSRSEELLDRSLATINELENQSKTVQLGFVGRHVNVKGIDLLLKALGDLQELNWHLQTIGDGPELPKLKELAKTYKISERVQFHGKLPNSQAMSLLTSSDLLILPSRGKDGWGVVVNESLMYGVPVLCSSYCGAGELLDGQERGEVFSFDETPTLREVLASWIKKGKRQVQTTKKIARWAECLNAEVAANYLLEIIEYSHNNNLKRPIAPWLNGRN